MIVLERFLPSSNGAKLYDAGTFGMMNANGKILFTLEDEWRDNETSISCVPSGVYPLRRTVYNKHGYSTYEICDVPGRTRILIHPGNTEEHTEGCVLVGTYIGILSVNYDEELHRPRKKLAVLKSRQAFDLFMEAMNGKQEDTIAISWRDDATR
jgi:hypothetical protein